MVFRGQNYLSGAMRRIGQDVRSLNATQLAQAQKQVNVNRQRISQQMDIAMAERTSLISGSRNLGLQLRKAGLDDKAIARQTRLRDLYANHNSLLSRQLGNITRIQQIQAIASRRRGFELSPILPPGAAKAQEAKLIAAFNEAQATAITKANAPPMRTLPKNLRNLTQEQLSMAYSKELLLQDELQTKLQTNIAKRERLIATINQQSLAERKVAAQTAEEAARVQLLTDRLETLNIADQKQIATQRQLAMQMRAMPWQNFANGASKVEHAGRLIQMFGLIGAAGMGFMANSAAQFQTSMTQAATQSTTAMNNTTQQVVKNAKYMQTAITGLLSSGKTVAQPADLTNALYQIFSGLSFKGSQISQLRQGTAILKDFNKLYTANYGQVQFNDIVSAGINLINNFRLKAGQLPRVLNTMQASVRFGAMSMGQFVGSMSQVVPAFRSAHYSFSQLAKDVAFVSRLFPQSLRTGTTGLARLSEMFARANTIQGIQQKFGVNIAPHGQLMPINRILQSIEKARPGVFATSIAIGNFFKEVSGTQGTIQARRVLAGYVQEMGLYHTVAKQVAGDSNEVSKSLKAMSETPAVKWEAFKNQIRAVTLELGAGAIPAFQGFAKPLEQIVHWFDQLNPRTQKMIGYWTAIATVGALAVGTFLAVAGAIAKLTVMARIAIGLSEGEGLLGLILRGKGKFAGESGLVSLRFGLIVGTVGLLILAFTKFHTQTQAVINALGGLKNTLAVVISLFAAWKLVGYALMFSRIAAETVGLATGIKEIGTAAKIATIETVGLRTALMGIAGLVVTATILIISRKQVSAAGRSLLGDEIAKELDPATAKPKALSFGQKLGNWLFESPTTAAKNFFNAFKVGKGGGDLLGWDQAVKQQTSGIGRVAVAYKAFLNALDRPVGTPAALKQFLALFSQHGLSKASSTVDIQSFMNQVLRASLGTRNVRNLDAQMKILRKTMFQMAHHDPFGDMNNRLTQSAAKAAMLKAGLQGIQKINQNIGKSAVQMGVVSTPAFKQLFENLVAAKIALKSHEGNVRLQRNVINAQQALQTNVSKQQAAAATKASTAQANAIQQVAPAWQAATQSGIVATATYVRLYKAVNAAQTALARNPTIANQRAFLDAQRALDSYVQNVSSANQQVAQNTQTTFADMFNNIKSMFDQFQSTEQGLFGTLFQGPFISSPKMQNFLQWGGVLTGKDLVKDLHSQITAYKSYHRDIDRLRRRGAPEALIQQLMALGPEAAKQIRALSRLSGPELRKYFRMFGDEQKLVNKQALHDLNRQLGAYKKFGRNIAKAMAAGIQQESPAIERAIKKMVMDAFPGLKGSPGGRQDRGDRGSVHHHTHIHGKPTPDQMTQGRHSSFRNRNKHRRNRYHGDRNGG